MWMGRCAVATTLLEIWQTDVDMVDGMWGRWMDDTCLLYLSSSQHAWEEIRTQRVGVQQALTWASCSVSELLILSARIFSTRQCAPPKYFLLKSSSDRLLFLPVMERVPTIRVINVAFVMLLNLMFLKPLKFPCSSRGNVGTFLPFLNRLYISFVIWPSFGGVYAAKKRGGISSFAGTSQEIDGRLFSPSVGFAPLPVGQFLPLSHLSFCLRRTRRTQNSRGNTTSSVAGFTSLACKAWNLVSPAFLDYKHLPNWEPLGQWGDC